MKRFLYYFVWTIIIGIIVYLGIKYQIHLGEEAKREFKMLPVVRFTTIFPIIIGLSLRLPKLIIEVKEKRQWTFDWIKVVAIGLPTLYIAALPILSTTSLGENLFLIKEIMLIRSSTLITTAGIVFGYILLDSLKHKS
ncbi:hypothetical protein [Virgibacillus sp. DJP39]|uniref:hypothetical protein n=1 Tax=Virgibacillus sp. DJP39 TaxID=3409790 RepID=UPI003BB7F7CF